MLNVKHLTMAELEAGLDEIRRSPKDGGVLKMIVRRPRSNEREVLQDGELDPASGLVGDSWKHRGGSPDPERQLNVMNARVIALLAQDDDRWRLAGDQLFVDLDLSVENLPAGTRLALGSAVIEVTAPPHNGCKKFVERFGLDAVNFVNSPLGKQLHLRGINARVVRAGVIQVGDPIRKTVDAV
jgi:MOSC domain-containing protein YiiM